MASTAAAMPAKAAPIAVRGHSTALVLVLCIACFFAGRVLPLPGLPGPSRITATLADDPARRSTLENITTAFIAGDPTTTGTCQQPAAEEPAQTEQPPRKFSSFEEALLSTGALDDRPPLPHGESGSGSYIVQPIQQLSWYPRAYLLPRFLDPERCQRVIDIATKRLSPSGLALRQGERHEDHVQVRTSSGTFLTRYDDPVFKYVEDKIAAVTMIPADHGEPFNFLRYEPGQHYEGHYDSFAEEDYGPQSSQRIATLLLYLNDPEEGGETTFALEGKDGLARLEGIDYSSCDLGIKVKPRQGDALLFFSAFVNGTLDKHSLHGACDVVKGVKFSMAKAAQQGE